MQCVKRKEKQGNREQETRKCAGFDEEGYKSANPTITPFSRPGSKSILTNALFLFI